MRKIGALIILVLLSVAVYGQAPDTSAFTLNVVNEKSQPVDGATVQLLKADKLIKASITDAKGMAAFGIIANGDYTFSVSYTGYTKKNSGIYHFPSDVKTGMLALEQSG